MNAADTSLRRQFIYEAILIAIFLIGFVLHITESLPREFEGIVLGAMGTLGLIPVLKSTWGAVREKKVSVDLLATIALFFSFVSGEWGSMLFINLMLSSARVLDLYTRRRANASLEKLAKLKPLTARVLHNEHTEEIPLTQVHIGDLVVVNLGEQIPVDGVIVKGSATIDQSSLTGESLPVLHAVNDPVLSATVVASGNIVVRADRIGTETTFERMIKLVEDAQAAKTRMTTLAERFASWYIGIMVVAAVVIYLVTKNVSLVLSVVLVVCADDIAIAIPLAYLAGVGNAARRGIIVKGADFLERFAKITTLIVDKTGTLTMGKLVVKTVRAFGPKPIHDALLLSGMICRGSTHPISKAIIRYIEEQGITCEEPDSFEEVEGRGIRGEKNGTKVLIGRLEFLQEQGVTPNSEVAQIIADETNKGNNVTLVAVNNEVVGMFGLADEIRRDVPRVIAFLKNHGVKQTVMLTGDNEVVARNVAEVTGIQTYHAGLLPEKKVSALEQYLGKNNTVAMVGDGVNDAAVLARADIGIAMGGIGSDAAIESADVVLMKDDFEKIVELRDIADRVLAVAYSNFAIWAVVNTIGLYFVFTGVFDPSKAAAYNFLTDFVPIINSLRIFYYKKRALPK